MFHFKYIYFLKWYFYALIKPTQELTLYVKQQAAFSRKIWSLTFILIRFRMIVLKRTHLLGFIPLHDDTQVWARGNAGETIVSMIHRREARSYF